jgi:diacylglycerol kinase family enzyme
MIMKPEKGNVSEHPAVHEFHATKLHVRVTGSSPAQADGEVITEGAPEFDFRVLPARLPILVA